MPNNDIFPPISAEASPGGPLPPGVRGRDDGDDAMAGENMMTAERSMFGTRLPRPTGVGRHLLVVFVLSAVALVVAIAFAERAAPRQPAAPAADTR